MSGSDRGSTAVYAAEIAAFDGTTYESVTELSMLQGAAEWLIASEWWAGGPVEVAAARAGAESSTTRSRAGAVPLVRLAAPQLTRATLTHELAHVLAGVQRGHDAVFRRAHVDIVAVLLGDEPAGWLADAYVSMGLAIGARAWPPPAVNSNESALPAAAG